MPVLNILSFLTRSFHKYKKHKSAISIFYQGRRKVDLVLYTYAFIYLKATIKKFYHYFHLTFNKLVFLDIVLLLI